MGTVMVFIACLASLSANVFAYRTLTKINRLMQHPFDGLTEAQKDELWMAIQKRLNRKALTSANAFAYEHHA